ncbi:hypothetical protein TNCV_1942771 [Trichonephila clavipes]|nr:hypothetical protein TNCV_1942771 [Trichonephila clavipes]
MIPTSRATNLKVELGVQESDSEPYYIAGMTTPTPLGEPQHLNIRNSPYPGKSPPIPALQHEEGISNLAKLDTESSFCSALIL